jgi:serine/threonine protein phosphatase PrpC
MSNLSNRFVVVAIAALAALAIILFRHRIPCLRNNFSLINSTTSTPTAGATPDRTSAKLTPSLSPTQVPTPTSTSTSSTPPHAKTTDVFSGFLESQPEGAVAPQAEAGTQKASAEVPQSVYDTLLQDVKPYELLRDSEQLSDLLTKVNEFSANVASESNLDKRTCISDVPPISYPADGDWKKMTVQIYPLRSYDGPNKIEDVETTICSEFHEINGHGVNFAYSQGPRETMEDCHIACSVEIPNHGPASVVGVFDGHGGGQAAAFVQKNIQAYLSTELAGVPELNLQTEDEMMGAMILALHNTIIKLDAELLNAHLSILDGTKAIVSLILNDKLIVANLGDSRAILVRDGQAIPLTVDARIESIFSGDGWKPQNRYEAQVVALGGIIIQRRVYSTLATPAAMGDHSVSPQEDQRKAVINVPEISVFPRKKGDRLLMASDGLWNALSSNMAAHALSNRPTQVPVLGEDTLAEVPAKVSDIALLVRSALAVPDQNDNVTAVDIYLAGGA